MVKFRFLAPLILAALVLSGCVTDSPEGEGLVASAEFSKILDLRPGEKPATDSLEGGLWMAVERIEKNMRTSGRLYREEALREYIGDITCRLAGASCSDIRVYIVHVPYFNAGMYPNGMMVVNTGLLLRARNEAQLAAVLGHEIGHYLRRHGLTRFRNARDTSNFLAFFQIIIGAAGVPLVGDFAGLVAMASLSAYSRDDEREADRIGLELMAKAGYDPREAAAIWRQLIEEQKADEEGRQSSLFFASHPEPEERVDTLDKLATEIIKKQGAGETHRSRYRQVVGPHRTRFLRDETVLQRYKRAHKLMEMLEKDGHAVGEVQFFRGELHRQRNDTEKKDLEKALEFYDKAIGSGSYPPQLYKYLGLVHRKLGNKIKSVDALKEYLRRAPNAEDRLMIKSMIDRSA